MLRRICAGEGNDYALGLAHQHQRVVDSLLRIYPRAFDPGRPPNEPVPIAPIRDLTDDGVADLDRLTKQPDCPTTTPIPALPP